MDNPSSQEAENELDEILSELIDRAVEARMIWNKGGSFTRYQDRLRMAHAKSEAAIVSYTAKQVLDGKSSQVMRDFDEYSLSTDTDESELMAIRDRLLTELQQARKAIEEKK